MKRYVFIENSNKPSKEKYESLDILRPSNVSRPCLEIAHDLGYEVYFGTYRKNTDKIKTDLPFEVKLYDEHTYRSILNFKDNYQAYKNLMDLLSKGDFEFIHCNTPVGGLIGRICGKKKKIKKVMYTAHGFHFYKGAPFLNNTIYKWAEKLMAHWTDAIITMNQEDYEAAKKFKLKKNGKVFFCHGVGINLEQYNNIMVDINEKRKELNLNKDDIVLISMGDLVLRKNYSLALDIIANCNNKKIKYLICGEGPELNNLKKQAKKLEIEDQIFFLGYRTDIKELLKISDIFLFTTRQEGLPRSLMEAMAMGLPCIVSKIRGNVDLIEDGIGGYLCESNNLTEFTNSLRKLIENPNIMKMMKENNQEKIKNYDVEIVKEELKNIYKEVLKI